MRLFGYPYNDLVICKDSPDYLKNVKKNFLTDLEVVTPDPTNSVWKKRRVHSISGYMKYIYIIMNQNFKFAWRYLNF